MMAAGGVANSVVDMQAATIWSKTCSTLKRELGEALAWSLDPHEVADELWVDVPTVEARLRHLHPSEVHYLRRRLAAFDGPEVTYAHQAQHARDPR